MNVFNLISAGGGGGTGLYSWFKNEWIDNAKYTNPSFWFGSGTGISTSTQELDSSDIDLTQLPSLTLNVALNINGTEEEKKIINFLVGFTEDYNAVNLYRFYVDASGNLNFRRFNDEYGAYVYGFTPRDSKNAYVRMSTNLIVQNHKYVFEGEKPLPPRVGSLLGYAVSNKADTYPNKGVKDKFYYSPTSFLSFEKFGATECVSGTVTPASNQAYMNITHNKGKYPKAVFVITDKIQNSSERVDGMISVYGNGYMGSAYYSGNYNNVYSTQGNTSDSNTIKMLTESIMFGAGIPYRYYILF